MTDLACFLLLRLSVPFVLLVPLVLSCIWLYLGQDLEQVRISARTHLRQKRTQPGMGLNGAAALGIMHEAEETLKPRPFFGRKSRPEKRLLVSTFRQLVVVVENPLDAFAEQPIEVPLPYGHCSSMDAMSRLDVHALVGTTVKTPIGEAHVFAASGTHILLGDWL